MSEPISLDRVLLERAERALWAATKAFLTVKPSLTEPYKDNPRWSPWTRWCDDVAHETHDTCMAIRRVLREAAQRGDTR